MRLRSLLWLALIEPWCKLLRRILHRLLMRVNRLMRKVRLKWLRHRLRLHWMGVSLLCELLRHLLRLHLHLQLHLRVGLCR